jgi:ATP synthase protein I
VVKPEPGDNRPGQKNQEWEASVRRKEKRKIRARSQRARSIWFGFGMFGVIGWTIAVPMLLGIFLGAWIDQTWPSRFSWTLMLLLAGLIIGCLNAWNWIHRESGVDRRRHPEQEQQDDE